MRFSIFVIMVIYSLKCNCNWVLKWNDEFDGNKLDHSKWSVTDGKDVLEAPVNEEILSYSRDSDKNVHLIDGVLAITVVQDNNDVKSFTTGYVNSKLPFLYGRMDVRAALPIGNLLKTAIVLLPEKNVYGRDRVNGEIEIVADVQRPQYYSRASYNGNFGAEKTYPSLNDFQEYSLEWNKTMISWSLNGAVKRTFDIDRIIDSYYEKKGQPFDKKFYLAMRLQVFRFITDEEIIDEKFHKIWKCPSVLIDYVRLYQQDNNTEPDNNKMVGKGLKKTSKTKEDICASINKKLSLIYDQGLTGFKLFLIISIPIFSLVIILAILISVVVMKRRKRRTNLNIEPECDYADYLEINDDATKMANYEYTDVELERPENSYVIEQATIDSTNLMNYTEMFEMKTNN